MYCFRCGDALVERYGVRWCIRGEMALSEHLAVELTERFADPVPGPHPTRSFEIGGSFYCSGCGRPLDDDLWCARCQ